MARVDQRHHRLRAAGVRLQGRRRDRGPNQFAPAPAWRGTGDLGVGSYGDHDRRRHGGRRHRARRQICGSAPLRSARIGSSIPCIPTTCTTAARSRRTSGGPRRQSRRPRPPHARLDAGHRATTTCRTPRSRTRPGRISGSGSGTDPSPDRGSAFGRIATVVHVAAYHRRSGVELDGSDADVPLFADSIACPHAHWGRRGRDPPARATTA